jgi:hypothetical protein
MSELLRITERYRLDKLIAASDSASVFRATDLLSGETVALKLIRGEIDEPRRDRRAPLESAALALAACRHASLPRFLDYGFTAAGSAFLVTEYLQGASFEVLAGSPVGRLLPLLLPVLDGLEELERHQLAHRNLRTENLLLAPRGDEERLVMLGWGRCTVGAGEVGRSADLHDFAELTCAAIGAEIQREPSIAVTLPSTAGADPIAEAELAMLLSLLLQPGTAAPASLYAELRRAFRQALGGDAAAKDRGRLPADSPASPDTTGALQVVDLDQTRAVAADITIAVPRDRLLGASDRVAAPASAAEAGPAPAIPAPGALLAAGTTTASGAPADAAESAPAGRELRLVAAAPPLPASAETAAGEIRSDTLPAFRPADLRGHPDAAAEPPPEPATAAPQAGPAVTARIAGAAARARGAGRSSASAREVATFPGVDRRGGPASRHSRPTPPLHPVPSGDAATTADLPAVAEPGAPRTAAPAAGWAAAAPPSVTRPWAAAPTAAAPSAGGPSAAAPAAAAPAAAGLSAAAPRTAAPSAAAQAPAAPGAPEPSPATGAIPATHRGRAGVPRRRSTRLTLAGIGLAAMVALLLAVVPFLRQSTLRRQPSPAADGHTRPPGTLAASPPRRPGPATAVAPARIEATGEPRLTAAQALLAKGDAAGARRELAQVSADRQAAFRPAERAAYEQLTAALAADRRRQIAADLAAALRRGDVRRVGAALTAARWEPDLPAPVRRDLERARQAVELDARLNRTDLAHSPQEALRISTDLLALLPRYQRAGNLREQAAKTIEEQVDAALGAGDGARASTLLAGLRQTWPERPGLRDRADRIESLRRADLQLEAVLAAAGRAEAAGQPLQGLELLAGANPGARYRERFRLQRERLDELLARLDAAPPAIALRPGWKLEYDKGGQIVVPLRITDDLAVKSAELWVRQEGASAYQSLPVRHLAGADWQADIPPELHQNRTLEIYAAASDNSGHRSLLGSRDQPLKLKRRTWIEKIFSGKEGG